MDDPLGHCAGIVQSAVAGVFSGLVGKELLEAGELFGGGASFDGADGDVLHLGVGFFGLGKEGGKTLGLLLHGIFEGGDAGGEDVFFAEVVALEGIFAGGRFLGEPGDCLLDGFGDGGFKFFGIGVGFGAESGGLLLANIGTGRRMGIFAPRMRSARSVGARWPTDGLMMTVTRRTGRMRRHWRRRKRN
jgi:hypothetical protein